MRITNNIAISTASAISILLMACGTDDVYENALQQAVRNDGKAILLKVSSETPDADTRTEHHLATWHTEFASGDEIGVFAYDGTNLVTSNVKFTFDGTDWTGEKKVPYNEGYTYYAYYPYAGTLGNPPYTVGTSGDIDSRFASFISDSSNWFHMTDQSTLENFARCDYMHAQGVDAGLRTITFNMRHRKALAVLRTSLSKWHYASQNGTKYPVTLAFSGNLPCVMDNGDSYFLMKADVSTTIGGVAFSANAGRYTVRDLNLAGTPSFTYSLSDDGGVTWDSYSGTRPAWLDITPDIQDGSARELIVTADATTPETGTLVSQTVMTPDNDLALKAAVPVTGYRDLSMYHSDGTYRGTRTTANCYLVHAPGTYRIPLVYGNAIKDGVTNTVAYVPAQSGANIMPSLVRHDGQAIAGPYIRTDNGITVAGAKLLWQDAQGVISQVGYDSTEDGYLTFTVSADRIKESNALIAVTDQAGGAGTIVWSWHIWITPETLDDVTQVTTDNATYQVTHVNVGSVSPIYTRKEYSGQRCKVKATVSGTIMEFTVTQPDCVTDIETKMERSPYFQFGRKTPFVPSNGTLVYNDEPKVYDINGSVTTGITKSSQRVPIATAVSNPTVYYISSKQWTTQSDYTNLWNASPGTVQTVKTVYDPCPPGYCVPPSDLYSYMVSRQDDFTWNFDRLVWTKDTPNIEFPANGNRDNTNSYLTRVGRRGRYWSSDSRPTALAFNSTDDQSALTDVTTGASGNRCSGQGVRAIHEQ